MHSTPVSVSSYISASVFVELLAGTVGIFVLSVLFWKIGYYVRSWTRHRVLQQNKQTTTRYARTWYGWVLVETHERNKAFIQRGLRRILDWLSWDSPRNSYEWIWWDPGCEARDERRARRTRFKLLPRFLQSTDFTPAFSAPYPRSSVECRGALLNNDECQAPRTMRPDAERPYATISWSLPESRTGHRENKSFISLTHQVVNTIPTELPVPNGRRIKRIEQIRAKDIGYRSTVSTQVHSPPIVATRWHDPRARAEALSEPNKRLRIRHLSLLSFGSESPHSSEHETSASVRFAPNSLLGYPRVPPSSASRSTYHRARKYRAWSARMQLKARHTHAGSYSRDSSGPPGTPATAPWASSPSGQGMRGACSFQLGMSPRMSQCPFETKPIPITALGSKSMERRVSKAAADPAKFNTAPVRFRPSKRPSSLAAHTSNQPLHSWHGIHNVVQKNLSLQMSTGQSSEAQRYQSVSYSGSGRWDGTADDVPRPPANLSDWESRLIDQLNRKVKWVYDEMTPGQKPYQFTLLANHWLNRETWLVTDPVSRVSTDYRRRWGDPRCPRPDDGVSEVSKRKYPEVPRERARIPRLDSWRAAVNRQRSMTGNQNVLRSIQLYEGSAEEPPDGHIDTAAWMLPRPPQGFGMSTKQRNAWYERGTGWSEKLEDWQQVGHGYRLDKFIHEGRVNRTRVKELASHIQKGYRTASSKLLPMELEQ